MGAFDRFRTAEVMGVRQYIEPGLHVLLVKRTDMGPSKNPQKKNMERTVVEFKVVQSDTLKAGSACSLVETDEQDGYAGNVLAFTAGILGYGIDEMKADPHFEQVFDGAYGKDQILTGMLVACNAQQVATKKGGTYTAKTWEPVLASMYSEFGLIAPDGAFTGEEESDAEPEPASVAAE